MNTSNLASKVIYKEAYNSEGSKNYYKNSIENANTPIKFRE